MLGTLPTGPELAKAGPPGRPVQPTELEQLGLTVSPATGPNREGVLISDVDGNADAALKGIRVGDLILEISGTVVSSPDDVVNAIREANRLQRRAVLLRIRSGTEARFVAVQLKRS
jgi:serine protease Do